MNTHRRISRCFTGCGDLGHYPVSTLMPPSPAGFARVVPTGDVAGGRYVSNLTSLTVTRAPVQVGTGGDPTTQVAPR